MNLVWTVSDKEPNRDPGEMRRDPGFSLYNIKKDPFEIRNMGAGDPDSQLRVPMTISRVSRILRYVLIFLNNSFAT